ncbi:MAG: antibiotic biosynthesis monooxygenase [Alteromonadaceae bacterium TMED7]|nr:antibiotic biosynthesis monooxygenase [Alteromonadaceae bacterium]RPH21125.1 MAG: antibiotic biosynthesis monooxygenase [Alteromonadaceae bacterium TMED7]HCL11864.1 antibiotic biosynthesis monooxygenase [Alteromonas sp.]|tara:strand:+ start:1944 stop:2507 length:564 start_codon:yes stop_codon:yes gene_type:complete
MNTLQQEPITVIISRRVKPEDTEAFEALSAEMTHRASQFKGYLSTAMFRPAGPDDPEYRIIFKFTDQDSLAVWEASDERAEMLEKVEDLLISPSEREKVSGLVTWFSLPSKNPVTPPPRYKMTIVSWLALYPAVTAIFWLFGPWLAELPLLIRTMIVTGVVMVLMSYVLMPFMTKRFAFWLYPHKKR